MGSGCLLRQCHRHQLARSRDAMQGGSKTAWCTRHVKVFRPHLHVCCNMSVGQQVWRHPASNCKYQPQGRCSALAKQHVERQLLLQRPTYTGTPWPAAARQSCRKACNRGHAVEGHVLCASADTAASCWREWPASLAGWTAPGVPLPSQA